MTAIKFGTDGWRAIIAKEYTVENVTRVSEATAKWMLKRKMSSAVIGYDCRFGGQMFAEYAARVLGDNGIKVYLSPGFVSTPMVSLGVVKLGANMGIVITASHNPPSYNGFKLKSSYGGPTSPNEVEEVEAIIPENAIKNLPEIKELEERGLLEFVDLEGIYMQHVEQGFDLNKIKSYGKHLVFDAMYGAGQNVMKKLFPDACLLHCDFNPSFHGRAPEPIQRNLPEISDILKNNSQYTIGVANDGDADRIGLFDEDGNFIDSHHILLLLLYYLVEYKKQSGKVVITFSVTEKMKKLAEMYGLECEVTKIGFKYIAEIMTKEDVLVGGEESGGLAVKGHLPERDGVWIGLMVMEFMALTGKSLKQLIQEVYAKVGSFACDRDDLHLTNEIKNAVMDKCAGGEVTHIGSRPVTIYENIDGHKFFVSEGEWIMVRASGTEPVVRVYGQSSDFAKTRELIEAAKKTLLG
jgi:phosphomannomutase